MNKFDFVLDCKYPERNSPISQWDEKVDIQGIPPQLFDESWNLLPSTAIRILLEDSPFSTHQVFSPENKKIIDIVEEQEMRTTRRDYARDRDLIATIVWENKRLFNNTRFQAISLIASALKYLDDIDLEISPWLHIDLSPLEFEVLQEISEINPETISFKKIRGESMYDNRNQDLIEWVVNNLIARIQLAILKEKSSNDTDKNAKDTAINIKYQDIIDEYNESFRKAEAIVWRNNVPESMFLVSHWLKYTSTWVSDLEWELFEQANPEIWKHFDAHGITKLNQLTSLLYLLEYGIDTNRAFSSASFSVEEQTGGASWTSSGTCYKDWLAIVVAWYKKYLKSDWISFVFINDVLGSLIPTLQENFPDFRFYLLSEQAQALQIEKDRNHT